MAHPATGSVARQIESLFDGSPVAGLSDRHLLERFIARRDAAGETAFAALVARHGPMVLGVCRQRLGDLHHAEDAFQAVFMVLARKAPSIRQPDRLANWLYGVALRTARKAKVRLARQHPYGEDDPMTGSGAGTADQPTVASAEQSAMAREQAEALRDEIDRLPGSFRLPIVLCNFEGLTLDEAARQLRWPLGTLRSRLARARDKLRRGLTRRGVALSAAALASALGPRSISASISSSLCEYTTRAAMSFAAGQAGGEVASSVAAALAREVLRSMLLHSLRVIALTLLALGAVATGAGYLSSSLAMKDEPKNLVARQHPKPATKPASATQLPAPGRMFIVGRVLDPAGKPVAGAPVEIIGRPRRPLLDSDEVQDPLVLMGQGATDATGRFRLDAPRSSSIGFFSAYALTAIPGFGLGWAELNADAAEPAAELRLRPEQIIRGRLLDVSGQPAAGVELQVAVISPPRIDGRLPASIAMGDGPPEGCRLWPSPVKSDDRGRFMFTGIGPGLDVYFAVHDHRFAPQLLEVQTNDRDRPAETTLVLQASRVVEGRVLDADTGEPVPGALISLGGNRVSKSRADGRGQFRAYPPAGDRYNSGSRIGINVFAPEGAPYLVPRMEVVWTKGAVKRELDIKLRRGVLLRGKVTEQGTGRSLSGSTVQYEPTNGPEDVQACREASVASHDDGSFQIVVPPGKGHLLVFGPTPDYLLEVIGWWMLSSGHPGGERYYAHRIIPYEAKAGDPPHEINPVLRAGRTIKGRVIGPEGQDVADAVILTRLHIEPFNPFWRGDIGFQLHARAGSFELHGLDPETSVPAYFLDADHEWGATLEASGKLAGEKITVRLQRCGQATARLIDRNGKPFAKEHPWLEIIATPKAPDVSRDGAERAELSPDVAFLSAVDPKHYRSKQRPLTDAAGRVTLPALIPGAPYRLLDRTDPSNGHQVRREFTAKPGETLDLGDILIARPSP